VDHFANWQKICSFFQNIVFASLETDEQTNMPLPPPASLAWWTHNSVVEVYLLLLTVAFLLMTCAKNYFKK